MPVLILSHVLVLSFDVLKKIPPAVQLPSGWACAKVLNCSMLAQPAILSPCTFLQFAAALATLGEEGGKKLVAKLTDTCPTELPAAYQERSQSSSPLVRRDQTPAASAPISLRH